MLPSFSMRSEYEAERDLPVIIFHWIFVDLTRVIPDVTKLCDEFLIRKLLYENLRSTGGTAAMQRKLPLAAAKQTWIHT